MMVVAGLGLAAPVVVPPEPEQLVEGHTVFTVIEQVNARKEENTMFAAAVAVLVREVSFNSASFRYPGVLWFNDQYLVNPNQRPPSTAPDYRYPCRGAVIAVQAGGPSPVSPANPDPLNTTFNDTNYIESYRIMDPNDYVWTIDKWFWNGTYVWSVPILNDDTRYNLDDDGLSCPTNSPRRSRLCADPMLLPWNDEHQPAPGNDSGRAENRTVAPCPRMFGTQTAPGRGNGYGYICGGKDTSPAGSCSPLEYNALLFFLLDDLTVAGTPKNHSDGSTNRTSDVAGCDADHWNTTVPDYTHWPCPGADDDREGNSHAYNPERQYPLMVYAGRNNHGGSADCTGDATADQYCHATRKVDIYYGKARVPTTRVLRFNDQEGVTAPYHCHEHMTFCNQEDVFAAMPR